MLVKGATGGKQGIVQDSGRNQFYYYFPSNLNSPEISILILSQLLLQDFVLLCLMQNFVVI